jgi:pimeloyl-ACP methyl ester carboxylesterase
VEAFERRGLEHWARESMAGRLGSTFSRGGTEWWTQFMGRSPLSTQIGFTATIACADIRDDVPKIACPTLVITTEGSGLASVDETRVWQQTIRDSELVVLPGDSFHVAATDAEQCAQATLSFIRRREPAT